MSEEHVSIRVRVTGEVQGVGYRHWTKLRATRAGLTGFVRNRSDGSVEAVFAGPAHEVDDMVMRCRIGPRSSAVTDVASEPWTGADFASFTVLPTD